MRLLVTVFAIAALAAFAAPAGAHPPDQHKAQLMPASALGMFDWEKRAARVISAECQDGQAGPYPCNNIDLAAFVPLPALGGPTGNDIWGWTDPETGKEYAIMGTATSTGFVDVTDPSNPTLVAILPTRGRPDFVLWRDVKVSGNYAYIVSEVTDSGLQVFDLTRLRDEQGIVTADATYDEFSTAHNISINSESQTAYAVGTDVFFGPNVCGTDDEVGGLHMIDISDPLNPTFAGCALVETTGDGPPNNYVHDVECVIYDGPDSDYTGREICFGSNEDAVVIYDVTDKSNPQVLSQTTYDTVAYTHQGSLTEDQRYFIFGDELDEQDHSLNTTTYILDVEDLDNPPVPKAFEHPTGSIDHNLYIHGNQVFQSNYMAGLRVLEFDNDSLAAGQLREVAYFDVVPEGDIAEFAGTWSNYRFPSGTVVASAIENEANGMFVLKPRIAPGPAPRDEEPQPQPQPQSRPAPPPEPQQRPAPAPAAPVQAASADERSVCASAAAFRSAGARTYGRRVRLTFATRANPDVAIDVFRSTKGRRVVTRRVARFRERTRSFTWNGRANVRGRRVGDGLYFVRYRTRLAGGRRDARRVVLRRRNGRWTQRPSFQRRSRCGMVRNFRAARPAFGGRTKRSLPISYRLARSARVRIDVLRGRRVVKRIGTFQRRRGRLYRDRLAAKGLKRGNYRIRLRATRDGRTTTRTIMSRRI